jgi:hypothetical protein
MTQLPEKLSDLLRLAVRDCMTVEKMPDRRLDMETFHWPSETVCVVCMAGAVMDRTLGADPDAELGPDDFDRETGKRLHAIDAMRQGELPGWEGPARIEFSDAIEGDYDRNLNRASWQTYLAAADLLERHGL